MIFDVTHGYPHPLYNERVFCALGAGVGAAGALSDDAFDRAVTAIERFAHVARAAGVDRLRAFATSAVRDASNGGAFAEAVRARTGCEIHVLSGEEEARLSAEGAFHGLNARDGVAADLGGGSLEVARIRDGKTRDVASLPLGTVRLAAKIGGDRPRMAREIEKRLDRLSWLKKRPAQPLFLIGGAWRDFARLRIAEAGHPLKIIHGFTLPGGAVRRAARTLLEMDDRALADLPGVSANRRAAMPLTGLVMAGLADRLQPRRVTFSAAGVREGYARAHAPGGGDPGDPLLAAAAALAEREGRFGDASGAFMDWLAPLPAHVAASRERLQRAACALSDIAWREHPDHRAAYAFERSIQYPFPGIDHGERVFVALALHVRYGGRPDDGLVAPYLVLLSRRAFRHAEALGHALRLAHRISAGCPDLLKRSALEVDDKRISIRLPGGGAAPDPSRIERSFERLCAATRRRPGTVSATDRAAAATAS